MVGFLKKYFKSTQHSILHFYCDCKKNHCAHFVPSKKLYHERTKKAEIRGRKSYEDFLYLHKRYVRKVLYGGKNISGSYFFH